MSIAEVKADVARLASSMSFEIVEVPADLASMPVMDAIHVRLLEDVAAFGGYALLARALPAFSAKVWQGKVERTGRSGLPTNAFMQLVHLFRDPILVALIGHECGLGYIDMSSIPDSEFSSRDLQWALSSLSAEGMLACCELRENSLDGVDGSEARVKLGEFARQATVLVRQMDLALKARSKH